MGGTDSRGAALSGVFAVADRDGLGDEDAGTGLQLLKAAGSNDVSGIDAFDGGDSVIGGASLDVLLPGDIAGTLGGGLLAAGFGSGFLGGFAALWCAFGCGGRVSSRVVSSRGRGDDVDEGFRSIVLDGGVGDQGHVVLGGHEQTGVHELVGKEDVVAVVKLGAEVDGAGGGVDLVVDGDQLAGGQLGGLVTIVGFDGEVRSFTHLLQHVGEVILGEGEDYGDGLDLGNDGEHGAAAGLDQVAGIDEAEANASGEGRDDVAVGQLHLVKVEGALIGLDQPLVL